MYNYLIILLIFFILILLLAYFNSKRNIKLKANWELNFNTPENFENNNFKLNVDYNLIKNNCFDNGRNLENYINQVGHNNIIKCQNPGKSQYSLHQKNNSLYEISCENSINSTYLLYFYICLENIKINEFNFESFVKIRMPTKDYSNYLPKIQYNVIKKITLGNNKNWYHIKINYNSKENVLDKQIISFNNQQKKSTLYMTDLSLYKVLDNAPNFIFNKNLICFIDSINYNSSNNILHDISGNNNDMYLNNIPKKNENYIHLTNTKINGFPSNNINSEKFTIIFTLNKQNENKQVNSKIEGNFDNENNINNKVLLSIQGNNNYAFEIGILDDYLYLIQNNKKTKSNKPLNYYHKSTITILYENDVLNIYNDNLNILSKKINKIYFNNKPIIINKNKNLDLYVYNILVYNRLVETNELNNIRDYFITNQNKNTDTQPNILDLTFDNIYDNKNYNNPLVNSYDKFIEPFQLTEEEMYQEIHDNVDNNIKLNCFKDCNKLCKKFLDGSQSSIDKYKNCLSNCKNVMNSCNEYCKDNNDEMYCSNDDDNLVNNKCPKVYKKNGKYIVYIPENGIYSDFFTGEKIFSDNIDKARNMYAYNFPNCPIPKELVCDDNKNKEHCPYTVNELNPCNSRACSNVNWNVTNYKDLVINEKCKKVISNYCHINYDKDDNCACWDPKYKNNSKCVEFRKFFENPNDYCNLSSFNIEDHPDFNKYVKKDKIPCWGCNISE